MVISVAEVPVEDMPKRIRPAVAETRFRESIS